MYTNIEFFSYVVYFYVFLFYAIILRTFFK